MRTSLTGYNGQTASPGLLQAGGRWFESTRPNHTSAITLLPLWNGPRIPAEEYGYLVSQKMFLLPSDRKITGCGHRGGSAGYSAWIHYSPDLDLSISILANSDLKFFGVCRVQISATALPCLSLIHIPVTRGLPTTAL